MQNPHAPGTHAHQVFAGIVSANSHLTITQLRLKHQRLTVQARNFLVFSTKQMMDMDFEAAAIAQIIEQRERDDAQRAA